MSQSVTDKRGRKLTFSPPKPSELLDFYEACGRNSGNQAWVQNALPGFLLTHVDDVPKPRPTDIKQLRQRIDELGFDGISAMGDAEFTESAEVDRDVAKN